MSQRWWMGELGSAHIGILGFARGGQSLARWLAARARRVSVSDRRSAAAIGFSPADYPGIDFRLSDAQDTLPREWDALCVSGGVPREHPYVQGAIAAGLPITNDAQLFLEHCPAPVVGITGSAGKTTTTTLVGDVLHAAGETVWVGGNIGNVLLDNLAEIGAGDVVVMELSSFQLEWMNVSLSTAAILNLTPNHLDRHGTMEAYIAAKARILSGQGTEDWAVLAAEDVHCRRLAARAKGQLAWYGVEVEVERGTCLSGEWLALRDGGKEERICYRRDIPLRGPHNLRNTLAACAIARTRGAPVEAMARAIRSFQPVAHRLQLVRELAGVCYVNDSIATSPERVLAALASYEEPLVLLLGGQDKRLPWRSLLKMAQERARAIVVFGEVAALIMSEWAALAMKEPPLHIAIDLAAATQLAQQLARAGDVVLLSPGGTSYDAYPNFEARGRHFHELVMSL